MLQMVLAIQFKSSTYVEQQKLSCSLTEIAISNGWRSSCNSPDQKTSSLRQLNDTEPLAQSKSGDQPVVRCPSTEQDTGKQTPEDPPTAPYLKSVRRYALRPSSNHCLSVTDSDSSIRVRRLTQRRAARKANAAILPVSPVSYTHLTLPTILLV